MDTCASLDPAGVVTQAPTRVKRPPQPARAFRAVEARAALTHSGAMPFVCDTPAAPTVLQDDDVVRITRWDFAPGAATGFHTHGWPYFVVMLTDGNLRTETDGVVADRPMKAGATYGRPAGVAHDVMNGSPHPIAFVEIEIKRPEQLGAAPST